METNTLITALTTGFTTMANNLLDIAVVVVPIGLTVYGTVIGIAYAKKFFNKIAK